MKNFLTNLFNKEHEVDIEKLQLAADLSVNCALVDTQLIRLAVKQNQLDSLQEYLSKMTAVNLNEDLELWKEVENLESYISAYQSINESNFYLKLQNSIAVNTSFRIAAFLLFPLIQNAIKYGYNSLEKYPVRIKLNTVGDKIKLEVSNRVNHHFDNQELTSIVSNFKARLSLLYPHNHELIINSNTMLFKATLIIG
jgi:LytS/YehU family sensor histidine kinase